ncbi:peptidylprolyl isomerase [Halobacteriales archaeon QS_8_65_32]|nr:MAG: peptidylprolyl isomerase [Halobacteriales archaeon QS_8_65_32]
MVENGRVAVVHYVGRIAEDEEAGAVFSTTDEDVALAEGIHRDDREYEPLVFPVGDGQVVGGIDEAVSGMDVDETRTVRVPPAKAFGPWDGERVIRVPREELEAAFDVDAEEGNPVRSETGETGWITEVTDEVIEVDFNHELAGEPVEFELRVLDVRDAVDG